MKTSQKYEEKMQKNSREIKQNWQKLKIKIKKIWNSEKLERNLKKSWEVFDDLVQNYSKANFETVFRNNEVLRKILQNYGKYLRNFEKLSMIFDKKCEKKFRK